MRKIIFVLFLLLIPLVLASKTQTTEVLHLNSTVTVYGKTLKILDVQSKSRLRVRVDGVEDIIEAWTGRMKNINEMHVQVLDFFYIYPDYLDTTLKIIVHDECGDNGCNITETKLSCCKDCGCETGWVCINNICRKHQCVIDADCDDKKPCTLDKCSNATQRKCSRTQITECINNDGCCLEKCSAQNDSDCKKALEEAEGKKAQPGEAEQPKEPEEKEAMSKGKKEGIFIIAGVALLVVIIGFFLFGRK